MIAAIGRRAIAPAAAADRPPLFLDEEIGAVGDELGVEPHNRAAGSDLGGIEERRLVAVDRQRHQVAEGFKVVGGGEAMAQHVPEMGCCH